MPAGFFYDPSSPDLCPTLEEIREKKKKRVRNCDRLVDLIKLPTKIMDTDAETPKKAHLFTRNDACMKT